MHQHLTERKTHAENMQISFYFCKTCICLKILENIQISVSMIDRLDITDGYSVKCEFIWKTVIFNDAALNISLRKFWKCNILWFSYLAEGFRMRPKVWSTLIELENFITLTKVSLLQQTCTGFFYFGLYHLLQRAIQKFIVNWDFATQNMYVLFVYLFI